MILDACHSGFALGQSVQRTRSAVAYRDDIASRPSRRVITSARPDQLALDNGPVVGHSLFTGMLVEGFNWGRADLDGNGLVTASELGLYLQQQGVSVLTFGETVATRSLGPPQDPTIKQLTMQRVWH